MKAAFFNGLSLAALFVIGNLTVALYFFVFHVLQSPLPSSYSLFFLTVIVPVAFTISLFHSGPCWRPALAASAPAFAAALVTLVDPGKLIEELAEFIPFALVPAYSSTATFFLMLHYSSQTVLALALYSLGHAAVFWGTAYAAGKCRGALESPEKS